MYWAEPPSLCCYPSLLFCPSFFSSWSRLHDFLSPFQLSLHYALLLQWIQESTLHIPRPRIAQQRLCIRLKHGETAKPFNLGTKRVSGIILSFVCVYVSVHVKKNAAQACRSNTIALLTILVYLDLHEDKRYDSWLLCANLSASQIQLCAICRIVMKQWMISVNSNEVLW